MITAESYIGLLHFAQGYLSLANSNLLTKKPVSLSDLVSEGMHQTEHTGNVRMYMLHYVDIENTTA